MKNFSFSSWGNDLYTGRRNYKVVQSRKKFYIVSAVIIVFFVLSTLIRGFNLGIDFTGGSQFQIQSVSNTSQQLATDAVNQTIPGTQALVSNVGANAIKIQTVSLSEEDGVKVRNALAKAYSVESDAVSFTSIGPTWGNDVFWAAVRGLGIFLLLAALFMTVYFRNWRMAVSGVAALFHDMIVTVGVYALIGWEITPATMIGFLTVIGYSMYDTVVVFDKVRENTASLTSQTRTTYEEQANLAVNQTMVRSINTTVVALLPVGSVLFIGAFILGAGSLRDIALALFVGMIAGAYSSIFLATPMEVSFTNRQKKIREHTELVLSKRQKLATELGTDIDSSEISTYFAPGQLLPGSHQGQHRRPKRNKRNK